MLDELGIRPGQTALDLGCGPGTDLASLAQAVAETGTVIGIDHDPATVDVARERTADTPTVTVRLGDIHDLPLPDRTADRARTDRVLQHVADPAGALREFHRVLRPGGRLVMGEPDWDTLTIDHPDSDLSRAYTRYVTDKAVRNARIGRQLPGWQQKPDSWCPRSSRSPPCSEMPGQPTESLDWSAPRSAPRPPDTSPRKRHAAGWTTSPPGRSSRR
ncbi:methyltransferase domain-containing protein [Streptomyces sp. M10(2022)]